MQKSLEVSTYANVAPSHQEIDGEGIIPAAPRLRLLLHVIRRNPTRMIGAAVALVAILMAFFGELVAPYSAVVPNYSAILTAPSLSHLFGTDQTGRDIFSRVLSGAHISLEIAAAVVFIGAVVGTAIGLMAGYMGGLIDEILMRVTDVFLAFPALVLAMAVTATLGISLTNTVLALAVVWWPWYARLIRGQVLSLREREYIEAAKVVGVSHVRIMYRHLLPNTFTPLIVQMSLDLGFAVLFVSSLSFIGLGAQPPTPEWGAMIADAQSYVRSAWWVAAFPGFAITLTVVGFNMLADILQELFDPRVRST